MHVIIFSTIFVWNNSHSNKKWAIWSKFILYWSSCKVLLLLSGFIETWILSTDFRKYSYHISWKFIRLEPSCSILKDGRMDRQTWRCYIIIVALRNFTNAPNNVCHRNLKCYFTCSGSRQEAREKCVEELCDLWPVVSYGNCHNA